MEKTSVIPGRDKRELKFNTTVLLCKALLRRKHGNLNSASYPSY
jgi:hypothetical protein